jgi:hypothetical protein
MISVAASAAAVAVEGRCALAERLMNHAVDRLQGPRHPRLSRRKGSACNYGGHVTAALAAAEQPTPLRRPPSKGRRHGQGARRPREARGGPTTVWNAYARISTALRRRCVTVPRQVAIFAGVDPSKPPPSSSSPGRSSPGADPRQTAAFLKHAPPLRRIGRTSW